MAAGLSAVVLAVKTLLDSGCLSDSYPGAPGSLLHAKRPLDHSNYVACSWVSASHNFSDTYNHDTALPQCLLRGDGTDDFSDDDALGLDSHVDEFPVDFATPIHLEVATSLYDYIDHIDGFPEVFAPALTKVHFGMNEHTAITANFLDNVDFSDDGMLGLNHHDDEFLVDFVTPNNLEVSSSLFDHQDHIDGFLEVFAPALTKVHYGMDEHFALTANFPENGTLGLYHLLDDFLDDLATPNYLDVPASLINLYDHADNFPASAPALTKVHYGMNEHSAITADFSNNGVLELYRLLDEFLDDLATPPSIDIATTDVHLALALVFAILAWLHVLAQCLGHFALAT
eukprot:1663401-Amphidinium_carterae.1